MLIDKLTLLEILFLIYFQNVISNFSGLIIKNDPIININGKISRKHNKVTLKHIKNIKNTLLYLNVK